MSLLGNSRIKVARPLEAHALLDAPDVTKVHNTNPEFQSAKGKREEGG